MSNIYCIDLGSVDTKIYNRDENKLIKEKTTVAIKNEKELYATGNIAYNMKDKLPSDIKLYYPIKNGVISDYTYLSYLLEYILKNEKSKIFNRPYFVTSIPGEITAVEERAFRSVLENSPLKHRGVGMVSKLVGNSMGMGINPFKTNGAFIVDMGGQTVEYGAIFKGEIGANRLQRSGGVDVDDQIGYFIRKKYDFKVGNLTCEWLKNNKCDLSMRTNEEIKLQGINMRNGMPEEFSIYTSDVNEAIIPFVTQVIGNCTFILERLSHREREIIEKNGIYFTGGLSRLKGLDELIVSSGGIKVHKYKNPEQNVINGIRRIMKEHNYQKYMRSL